MRQRAEITGHSGQEAVSSDEEGEGQRLEFHNIVEFNFSPRSVLLEAMICLISTFKISKNTNQTKIEMQ